MAIKRKLTSPTDVKGGSRKGGKGPKATPKTPGAKAAEPTAAEKEFNNQRAKHLRGQRAKAKGKATSGRIQKRLETRLKAFEKRVDKIKGALALKRNLLSARQAAVRKNVKNRQQWRRKNLLGRQKLHLKWILSRKPKIQGNKIVVAKTAKPKFKPGKAPAKLPLPRLVGGKIVTKKARPPKHEAGASAAAKRAAKTKKTGAAVEA
jgi:hypothetical protein